MSLDPFIFQTDGDIGPKLLEKVLIVPVVSSANVSQLAADLLITSLRLRRLAVFNPEFFVPVVGGREDGDEGITTPLELYGRDDTELLVIQQRSPVLKSRKQDFVTAVLDFIRTSGVESVLFLSGVDLSNRTDSQMLTPIHRIALNNCPTLKQTRICALDSLQIPPYTSPIQRPVPYGDAFNDIPFIPGGGLTYRILSSLPKDWPVSTASLLHFALEGDNRTDARLFASVVAKVVGLDISDWRSPSSWGQGLFGAPHDQTLYG